MNHVTDEMFKHAMETQSKLIRMQMEQASKIHDMMERIKKLEENLNE